MTMCQSVTCPPSKPHNRRINTTTDKTLTSSHKAEWTLRQEYVVVQDKLKKVVCNLLHFYAVILMMPVILHEPDWQARTKEKKKKNSVSKSTLPQSRIAMSYRKTSYVCNKTYKRAGNIDITAKIKNYKKVWPEQLKIMPKHQAVNISIST